MADEVDNTVTVPYSITRTWAWSQQQQQTFAELNFSEEMLRAVGRQNQLRMGNRRDFRSLRTRTVFMYYIPFGIYPYTPPRAPPNTIPVFQHYATHRSVKQYSYGMKRYRFFFHQLLKSEWLRNLPNTYYVGVATMLQLPEEIQYYRSWFSQVITDFGTSPADLQPGVAPVVSMNIPPTFPYNMFVIPVNIPGMQLVTTPLRTRGSGSLLNFVTQLKVSMNSLLPENSSSLMENNYRVVNTFLVILPPQSGGGGPDGLFSLTAGPSNGEWIVNPKALLTPEKWMYPTCFWECLMAALCIRQEIAPEDFTDHFDLWMKDMCMKGAVTARQRTSQMKRIQWNVLAFLHYCNDNNIPIDESRPIAVEEVAAIAAAFGFQTSAVLAQDGEPLVGVRDDLHLRRAESNHLILMLRDGHFSLVMSYTALIPVKECTACGERFSSEKNLKSHLEKRSCLRCECLVAFPQRIKPFESEAAWRHHRAHLTTECLFRTEMPEPVDEPSVERKRLAKRFPHDQDHRDRKNFRSKGDAFQAAMEVDPSPIRNWKEALFVDLESVVPMNGLEVNRSSLAYQQAYAIGWLKRSDAMKGCEPTLVYGMDCMWHFFHMLDGWHDELLEDETRVWLDRCDVDLTLDPTPRAVNGNLNYAKRLERSWLRATREHGVCPTCKNAWDHPVHAEAYKSSCAKHYWARNTAEKNCQENFNENAPRITIWAHNGGRYDWIFVHRYLMEHNLLRFCRVVRGMGKYYEIVYKGVFIFRDSMNFMMGSLERLGRDFQVETLKGVFPYRYLKDCSHIEDVLTGEERIRADLPASMFEIPEKVDGPMGLVRKRPMTEEEYVAFMTERNWVYDVRTETFKYLADDIKCLAQVMESFRTGWTLMPYQPELFKYCTIGQMCHTYFLTNYTDPRTYCTLDIMEDTFIRKALYGGRTEVFQRCVLTPERIHYVDVNSLYPYVMESKLLPAGEPTWHFAQGDPRIAEFRGSSFGVHVTVHDSLDAICHQLNQGAEHLYGFFEVDVKCATDTVYPILPERIDDKNMFTNCSKTNMVYYSEELKFAIARGCVVTKVHAWSQWRPQKVYSRCIGVLKAEKMRGEGKDIDGVPIPGATKNTSLRTAAKTAQNALYGKSIQFINESVQIVDNQDDLYRLVRTPESDVTVQPIYRSGEMDVVEVVIKPHRARVQHRSCSAIGTAILAEARMVLYSYFEEVQRVNGTILYCDTDSIVFAGDQALPDECLSESVYGKMKVEIDPDDIVPGGFVALAPKCYAFQLKDNSPYVKCKGVNLATNIAVGAETEFDELLEMMEAEQVLEELVGVDEAAESLSGLSFDHLRMMVMGEKKKIVTKQMQFLKTRDRHVACIDTVKLLKDEFDKRWILEHGKTVPWSDFNVRIEEKIAKREVAAVSDFLQQASMDEIDYVWKRHCGDGWFHSLFYSWLDSGEFSSEFYRQSKGFDL